MASLFRPQIVRYVDAAGKRCKAGTPGAKRVVERARKWYGKDIPGQTRPIPLASDKTAAKRMLADMVRDFERGAAGIVPAEVRERTLDQWLNQYHDEVIADGAAARHAVKKRYRIRRILTAAKWSHPCQMNAAPVKLWLAGLVDDGSAPATRNHYLSALREFAHWLVLRDALRKNPFVEIPSLNAEIDLRHARRALTIEELGRVLNVALASTRSLYRLSGEARHHLYLLACSSGFRAGELGTLTPAHFRLDGNAPMLLLPARTDKAGRPVSQPLPLDVAAKLKRWMDGKPRTSPLWPGSWPVSGAFMLRHDLALAGIEPVVDSPETGPLHVDFHALRHTYVSLLEVAGISLKQAMELARHRNPALTLKRYGKVQLAQLSQSVASLPVPGVERSGGPSDELSPLERVLCLLLALVAPPLTSLGAPARGEVSVSEQRRRESKQVASHRRKAG